MEESSNDTDPPSSKKSNGVGEKAVTSSELQDDIASLVSEARALIKYVARQREFLGNITDGVAAYDKLTNAIAVAVWRHYCDGPKLDTAATVICAEVKRVRVVDHS